jgi:hypothetical protein
VSYLDTSEINRESLKGCMTDRNAKRERSFGKNELAELTTLNINASLNFVFGNVT